MPDGLLQGLFFKNKYRCSNVIKKWYNDIPTCQQCGKILTQGEKLAFTDKCVACTKVDPNREKYDTTWFDDVD